MVQMRSEFRRAASLAGERGAIKKAEIFINAFVAVRGLHTTLFERARTERGASMVEYAYWSA